MESTVRGPRLVCFGECMLELQGVAFGAMHQTYGGDTLNTAVYAARCGRAAGLQVDYATALGDDPLSGGMLQRWQAEGIRTGLVQRLSGRLPGLYLIEVDERGERRFSYWRDRSAARDYFAGVPGSTPLERDLDRIDALYLSGISVAILPPEGRARLASLCQALHERGAMVAFDNNYRPRLWPDAQQARRSFEQFTAWATVGLLTLDDQLALWPERDVAAALEHMRALPCRELVVKRGAASTLVREAGGPFVEVPTTQVPRVVDTTAAGDSFAGAYLASRLAGGTPLQAAAAGNRLGARVVQHRGAVIPVEAMDDLLARR